MTHKIDIINLKKSIKHFYKPEIWHFVTLNASDIDGVCKLQWIFSKYEQKDVIEVFECDVDFNSTIDSIADIIPSAIMSEMEVVDLFGLKINNVNKGLYLDETSTKTPLRDNHA
jgi:Ni,Fe-hydrogenase III component G